MLPGPLPLVVQQTLLDDQVLKIQAAEDSVVLALSSTKVRQVMDENPSVGQAYQRNVALWERAVAPHTLSRHWLFGSCPSSVWQDLSSRWKPRVFSEGSKVVTDADPSSEYCVIVLSGTVLLKRRRVGSDKVDLDRLAGGSVLNELTLISRSDGDRDAYGDVLRVERDSIAAYPVCVCLSGRQDG
jgi:signal-transduction protein with cAMP-binding, CBS, and nucleotidyltransferase domain